jgi:hypothetical protein
VNRSVEISNSNITFVIKNQNSIASQTSGVAGISCADYANLVFRSDDPNSRLTVSGDMAAAGIGGSEDGHCGSLTFNSGTYHVTAGSHGAAIGTGQGTQGFSSVREIRITDSARITAISGEFGAAIGCGEATQGDTYVDLIQIDGGTVYARGEVSAVGIGTGHAWYGNSTVNRIAITGGDVTAMAGIQSYYGTGIGAGWALGGATGVANAMVDTIYISGGRVNASGQWGAGIGAGATQMNHNDFPAHSSVRDITIAGGTVFAESVNAAGIGSGFVQTGFAMMDVIRISGGSVFARSRLGSAIGGGEATNGGLTSVRQILITGGDVVAIGWDAACGIGSGRTSNGNSTIGMIDITGGNLYVEAHDGAGIGSGYAYEGNSFVGRIHVSNGNITAIVRENGAAIGSGRAHSGAINPGSSIVGMVQIDSGFFRLAGHGGGAIGAAHAEHGARSEVMMIHISTGRSS